MSNINQTIIVRTDLFNLPEDIGLLSAQIAHIHMEQIRQKLSDHDKEFNELENNWIRDPYLLVKKVSNKESLEYFAEKAIGSGITCTKWHDTVYVRISSETKKAFPNVLVGISLGPDDSDLIRTVVEDLPLL